MKRNTIRRAALLAIAVLTMIGCTACSTNAFSNADTYFASAGQIIAGGSSNGKSSASSASEKFAAAPIAPASDLVLDEQGNYSFTPNDEADYYLIYFCETDATDDDADYIYASGPIQDNGSGVCSGNLGELFNFAYGEYLVKVFAFPEITDTTKERSTAISETYVATGILDDPEITYFWDTNTEKMELVLSNIGTYTYEVYPDTVDVTFSEIDGSGVTTVSFTDIDASNNSIETDALKKGQTYSVTAVAASSSSYVTNAESGIVNVSDGVLLGDVNILSDGYSYSDGWASFPRLLADVNPDGGEIGIMTGRQGAASAPIVATPASKSSGSAYSYTIKIDFGGFTMDGTLELKSNGIAELTENGGGPIAAGTLNGSWVEMEDGTITISLSPADIKS